MTSCMIVYTIIDLLHIATVMGGDADHTNQCVPNPDLTRHSRSYLAREKRYLCEKLKDI